MASRPRARKWVQIVGTESRVGGQCFCHFSLLSPRQRKVPLAMITDKLLLFCVIFCRSIVAYMLSATPFASAGPGRTRLLELPWRSTASDEKLGFSLSPLRRRLPSTSP